MIDDILRSQIVPQEFNPSATQLKRWRRIAQRTCIDGFWLLTRMESDLRQRIDSPGNAPFTCGWLLPYRPKIRRVIANRASEGILLYLAKCPPRMMPVGVWLLGKCSDHFRLYHLHEFCGNPSRAVRRRVAQALCRLEAWHLLDAMARTWPSDLWVARLADNHVPLRSLSEDQPATPPRPFGERLAKYSHNVDQSQAQDAAAASRMPYWALDPSWVRTPPKSVEFIRRMLRRIHRWVHGIAE